MSILAKQPDLEKIINKAVKRIGENHALARDNKGVEMKAIEIEEDRKEFRNGRDSMTSVIEESLKAVADEMAEKMVLENTIDGMVKEVIQEQKPWPPEPTYEEERDLKRITACLKTIQGYDFKREGNSSIMGGNFISEFMFDVKKSFDPDAENAKEIEYKIKQCFRNTVFEREMSHSLTEQKHDLYLIKKEDIPQESHGCVTFKDMDDTRTGEGTYAFCIYGDELPIGNKTFGDYITIEDCCKMKEKSVNESTTDIIKKLVNKKLKDKLEEARGGFSTAKHPGLDTYEKSVKKSKTENNKAMKDTEKKFKEYNSFEYNDNPEFPHQEQSKTNADGQFQYYRNSEEDQEFVDDFAHPGLIDFDINNLNLDRLTKYLEGSSETGNAQTDKDGNGLGNVVPSDLGKKMLKSAENRKEKIAQQKASMSNLRGYTPDVQKVKQVKEGTEKDMDKMKKLWSYNKNTQ